ncbi:MAG: sigma-54 dependent transcriptional regulator [Byssovorax sp.]
MQPFALIVDDDPSIRKILTRELRSKGFETSEETSGEDGLRAAHQRRPRLVMLDIHMEGMSGIETLKRLSAELPGVPVVIMTGEGSIELAIEAFKSGAVDFVTKPFDRGKLHSAIGACLRTEEATPSLFEPVIIGQSPALLAALDLARKFARPEISILLDGETGTGKELFARTIHAASKRCDGPFVAVDCSNLASTLIESELFGHEKNAFTGAASRRIGRFEQAQGGTLFLDEVGNLPLEVQSKLLRVLQQRTIERVGSNETIELDIRLISATNVNLQARVAEGRLKQDLYYRLFDAVISPPPLRERRDDIPLLARHFINIYAPRFGLGVQDIDDGALAALAAHPFPGNVRQLESVMKAAVINAGQSPVLRREHLPLAVIDGAPPGAAGPASQSQPASDNNRLHIEIEINDNDLDLKAIGEAAEERAQMLAIQRVLAQGKRSLAELARVLKVDVKTLKDKLDKYKLR